MRAIKSTHIERILRDKRLIDVNNGSRREVAYILKRYANNDVQFKQLASPVSVRRSGYEEVEVAYWETRGDGRKRRNVMLLDDGNEYTKKAASSLMPDPMCPVAKSFWQDDMAALPVLEPVYYDYTIIRNLKPLNILEAVDLISVALVFTKTRKEKDAENRKRADRRTITNMLDILHGRSFDWFLTITFDATKVDRNDPVACSKKLRIALNHLQQRKYHCLEYFGVWEWHKDQKAIHYHLLIKGIDPEEFTPAIDMRETYEKNGKMIKNRFYGKQIKQNKKPVFNFKRFDFGFTTATRIGDNAKTISYITKYIVKQFGEGYVPYMDRARRYICSASLKKPEKYSLDEMQLTALINEPDSWLLASTNNLDFDTAKIIQPLEEDKNLIALFESKNLKSE